MARRITVSFVFIFTLVFVSSCNDMHRRQRILRKFKTTEVLLPPKAIMVKAGNVSETRLPSDTLRLIYYYDPTECYECAVVHAYDMCNLFDHHDGFEIIPLFSPPEEKKNMSLRFYKKQIMIFPYISA